MSSADAAARRRRGDPMLTFAALVAMLATLMPLLRVVAPGPWLLGAIAITVLVLGTGFVARRRFALPAVGVSLAEALVWVLFMALVFLRDASLFGVVPTPEWVRIVPLLVQQAMDAIVHGVAPMAVGSALAFMIVGATGLLAIAIDHVVLTARMPLIAAIALVMVSLIPAMAVPVEPDLPAFVLLAGSILFLVRAETRSRMPATAAPASGAARGTPAGVTATAAGIAAVAVVVALVVTPALPAPVLRPGVNAFGTGIGLDASLRLGDDLRRPREIEILRVRSDAPFPPYLRATTLTTFTGSVWEPDRPDTEPLASTGRLAPVEVDEVIRVDEYTTTVEVENLSSEWLPLAYPAVAVAGVTGAWEVAPANRTLVSRSTSSQGQVYQVTSDLPRPTLEQIRERRAVAPDDVEGSTAWPDDLPPIIAQLADEVTAGATTDYDRLIALQSWFRGAEFRYSLSAPVDEGFDGSGARAVAEFLQVREGYCIHFASAFALMARTLGMPSRIVVGYLPGGGTGDSVDGQQVLSVTTSRTHAWPEVHFEGIGWVPFEPTTSLGTPTAFSPVAPDGQPNDPSATSPGEASASPTPTSGVRPQDQNQGGNDAASGPISATATGWPPALLTLVLVIVLALPAVLRESRRRRQLAAAADGDAAAAWTLVQDTAIDLGIPVPPSESPRVLGARLAGHGAPADDMEVLVRAIERVSYAPYRAQFWQGDELAASAVTVRAALFARVSGPRRVIALVAPRSLLVRPGTVYAGASRAALATR